jgi:hypothetical protein
MNLANFARGLFGSAAPSSWNVPVPSGIAPQLGVPSVREPGALDPRITAQIAAQAQQPEHPGLFGSFGDWMKTADANGLTGADKLSMMGASLRDLGSVGGGGNNFANARSVAMQGAAQRQQKTLQAKQQAAMQSAMAGGKFDPQAYVAAGGLLGLDDLKTLNDLNRRHLQYVEGPNGINQIDQDTGESKLVQAYDRPAPAGYMWAGDKLAPIPGGPADIHTITDAATARRRVTVNNPTPSRARVAAPRKGGSAPSGSLASMSDEQLFALLHK